jgi:hypothetical protein
MHWSARRFLHRLHDEVGAAGLAAAAAVPGLSAAIDQHAAAVRDSTTIGLEASAAVAGAVLLAAYARGVLEHARQQGWRPPAADLHSYSNADWTTVRLVSVCALAASRGPVDVQLPSEQPPAPPALP